MEAGVTVTLGLPEHLRAEAARLYLDAFSAKLSPIIGRDDRAEAYLASVLRPDHALAALAEGALIGLAGFHDAAGGFVGGGARDLARVYGWPSTLWRCAAFMPFERAPDPHRLLIDGVAVSAEARGGGIGAALMDAAEGHAQGLGLTAVALQVVDANPRARRFYERRGYAEARRRSIGPLAPIFGFRTVATMVKAI